MARSVRHMWIEDSDPNRPHGLICKICNAQAYFSLKTLKIEVHYWCSKDCAKQLVTSVLSE